MGFLRLFLAICVTEHHTSTLFGVGFTAVYGFFVLSGFLITLILNEIYNDGWRGKGLFLLNRFLRIYPVYWVCLLLSTVCLHYAPVAKYFIFDLMDLPKHEWWRQISIFGLTDTDGSPKSPIVIGPAWTLSIELHYYLLIALVTGRSRRICWLWLACSLAFWGWVLLHGYDFYGIYLNAYSASLPFCAGSLCYHYREKLQARRLGMAGLLLIGALITAYPDIIQINQDYRAFYQFLCVGGFAFVIPNLYRATRQFHSRARQLPKDFEESCGDISYPLFLISNPVAAVILETQLPRPMPTDFWVVYDMTRNMPLFIETILYAIAISAAIVLLVQAPVEQLRKMVRRRAATPQTPHVQNAVGATLN